MKLFKTVSNKRVRRQIGDRSTGLKYEVVHSNLSQIAKAAISSTLIRSCAISTRPQFFSFMEP